GSRLLRSLLQILTPPSPLIICSSLPHLPFRGLLIVAHARTLRRSPAVVIGPSPDPDASRTFRVSDDPCDAFETHPDRPLSECLGEEHLVEQYPRYPN